MFFASGALSGNGCVAAMEAGWAVTEVGRQPWTVYGVLRTSQAATTASGVTGTLAATLVIYGVLTVATLAILRLMQRHWQAATRAPRRCKPPHAAARALGVTEKVGGATMIADTVAAVLVVVTIAYATLAGADFGGVFGTWSPDRPTAAPSLGSGSAGQSRRRGNPTTCG